MKKIKAICKTFIALVAVVICFGCAQNKSQEPQYDTINVVENFVIDENSVPIFPKKAALTTDTARRFSIDLPKRCKVDWDNQSVVSVVPKEKIEIVPASEIIEMGEHPTTAIRQKKDSSMVVGMKMVKD